MPDASDIRQALAAYLSDELDGIRAGLTTETRYRNFRDTSRSERLRVMGDDLYYLEIVPADEPTTVTDRDIGGTYHRLRHPMAARLFFRYVDDDAFADSSQPEWNDLTDRMHRALMAAEAGLTSDGLLARAQLKQPETDPPSFVDDLVTLGTSRQDADLAHVLTALVTLEENSRSSAG